MAAYSKVQAKYWAKHAGLLTSVDKIKLWPSRSGLLHGVREVKASGDSIIVSTHCGETFKIRDSKNGRVHRQLKNRCYKGVCKKCAIPDWKIEKYNKR
ncbi:MAG: pyrrolysine--tRNA(Pyl) ligase small subunit [Coriobacteriia bacterium]|nr:pyrrolysine--tRNA(Pyl) ligase small subunit [Coriobacteriia bacterium]